ncbi:MAG TPA: AAA family ATPase [Longimicrobiales bacterium]|nr:AAA family ATPase [Longimicrobiales bacterium]
MMDDPVGRVLALAKNVKQHTPPGKPKYWTACCPAHDDEKASLSITRGRDGRALLKCHTGCEYLDIMAGLGLGAVDGFADAPQDRTNGGHPSGRGDIIAEYDYVDAGGELVYQVVRLEPKDFRARRPNGNGGWVWERAAVKLLYRLPDVVDAVEAGRTVYAVEGEKAVDRLRDCGLTATCNPFGAGKFGAVDVEPLRGAIVCVIPDADAKGRDHAQDVAGRLEGVAAEIRILDLPDRPEKAGADDWLNSGHTVEELTELAFYAPIWDPTTGAAENSNGTDADSSPPAFATLAELLENPDLLKPPEVVVPRLGYRGRAVLLAADAKDGKTTLAAIAGKALTRRERFLGEKVGGRNGRLVWAGVEEAIGDAVRRFRELGADPDRVQVLVLASADLMTQVEELLTRWPADLVVFDSLIEIARLTLGKSPEDGDNSGWADVVRPMVALARKHDVAVLILHHVRRSDGQYRGAGEIAAAVDAILEMSKPAKDAPDQTLRKITGRGRWTVEPFAVRFTDDGQYELAAGTELSLDTRVLMWVEANPGSSKTAIRKGVTGRARSVDEALDRLVSAGALEHTRNGYHAAENAEMEMVG